LRKEVEKQVDDVMKRYSR